MAFCKAIHGLLGCGLPPFANLPAMGRTINGNIPTFYSHLFVLLDFNDTFATANQLKQQT